MTEKNLGEITKNIYDQLFNLRDEDRDKVMNSVMALLGLTVKSTMPGANAIKQSSKGTTVNNSDEMNAKDFFTHKNPQNRGEMLAVAARYLESSSDMVQVTKSDLENVFKEARRNFDGPHFTRDIKNALHNGKLFLKGDDDNSFKLSFYGQEYVDILPERERLKDIKKPRAAKKSKSSKKEKVE